MFGLNSINEIDNVTSVLSNKSTSIGLGVKASASLAEGQRVTRIGGSISYYYAFESRKDLKGSVRFELNSYCACFGFDKRVMIPIVLAFDSDGNEVKLNNMRYETIRASGTTPLHILLTGELDVNSEQVLKFIVLADNSSLDHTIATTSLQNSYGREMMNLSVNSYPLGDFSLKLSQF